MNIIIKKVIVYMQYEGMVTSLQLHLLEKKNVCLQKKNKVNGSSSTKRKLVIVVQKKGERK